MRSILTVGTVLVLAAPPAAAQSAGMRQDERDVLAVVTAQFDAMKARDTARMRSYWDAGARLVLTSNRNGAPAVRIVSIGDFLGRIASMTQAIEERVIEPQVQVHDNLATVWNRYEFLVDGKADHCGVDAFQLARFADGWKVIAVGDTQAPCPAGGRP